MPQSAAVLCQDNRSLQTLKTTLETLGVELLRCVTGQQALESIMTGRCSTLIVDFDLPSAKEVIGMAALLPPPQRPTLLAIASRAWPGTGQAFQSGASRILYKPIAPELLKQSLVSHRRTDKRERRQSERYEVKTLVYLELASGTVPAISMDIAEQGFAIQAIDPVPITVNLAFRCVLPGTNTAFHGHADVIWTSDRCRAGLFFSKLTPAARKHLNHWLQKRGNARHDKNALRDLLPPTEAHVSFALPEEELPAEVG